LATAVQRERTKRNVTSFFEKKKENGNNLLLPGEKGKKYFSARDSREKTREKNDRPLYKEERSGAGSMPMPRRTGRGIQTVGRGEQKRIVVRRLQGGN